MDMLSKTCEDKVGCCEEEKVAESMRENAKSKDKVWVSSKSMSVDCLLHGNCQESMGKVIDGGVPFD